MVCMVVAEGSRSPHQTRTILRQRVPGWCSCLSTSSVVKCICPLRKCILSSAQTQAYPIWQSMTCFGNNHPWHSARKCAATATQKLVVCRAIFAMSVIGDAWWLTVKNVRLARWICAGTFTGIIQRSLAQFNVWFEYLLAGKLAGITNISRNY